ncbi:MAG: ABC transporter ATP-binding protein [Gemmataceae bacterium]|nr:ABC transporter ATP-binding protein [Gemmataceae bacterium]
MPNLLEFSDAGRRDRALTPTLETPAPSPPAPLPQGERGGTLAPILLFQHVSKWYGPVIGINQVTLELRPGITGLVGHNGSGKSTLLRLAAGQMKPDIGSVKISGCDAWTAEAKRHIGYCPELDTFYEEMSGRRFVQTMARLCGYPRAEALRRTEETLTLVGMNDRAERRLAGYSKGMRQRIKLAQALLHDPELLLLDEPLSGIDPIGRRESIELFRELARRGKCLLISSHELEELEKLTDHVAIMAAGRIAAVGTLTQIRDLLDDHPLSIRIASDQNRVLAALLLDLDDVVGVDRSDGYLLVRAKNPRRFFQRFGELVLDRMIEIQHLETLDESTHDVLGYLLGGKAR